MDPTILAILTLVLGLAIGGWAGWFFGSQRFRLSEQTASGLRVQLDEVVKERDVARSENDGLKESAKRLEIDNAELKRDAANHDKQIEALKNVQEEMRVHFKSLGAEALRQNREDFLKQAGERFRQSEEVGEARIKALLDPVEKTLDRYEKSVKEMEADRKKEYGNISSLIDQVRVGQEAVRLEASNIVNSLRSAPKTSGRWGEQQFENLLDMAGLSKFTDYRSEVSVRSDDGLLRPDYVINLPGGRQLIVDIKCPLDAYLSATDILDPSEKKKAFERYAETVRGHANALSRKSYWSQFDDAPDFVILYIPGDNFHSAALEHRPTMWEEAAKNRVIISGPATFLPLARTIASMWDQEKLTDKAQEIIDLGRDLHHNLSLMTDRIRKLGNSIDGTAKAYNEFIKSADGKVILGARKLEELNLTKSDKKLGTFETVEIETRSLNRISPPSSD